MARYLLITVVLTAVIVGGTRMLFASVLRPEYTKDTVLAGMHLLQAPGPATVHRSPPPLSADDGDDRPRLDVMRERGTLRVGYLPDALPFTLFNGRGELVGFDADLAHRLAAELGLRLEFLPIDPRADRSARTRPPGRAHRSAALVFAGTTILALTPPGFAAVNAVLVVGWIVLAWRVGREYRRLATTGQAQSTREAPGSVTLAPAHGSPRSV